MRACERERERRPSRRQTTAHLRLRQQVVLQKDTDRAADLKVAALGESARQARGGILQRPVVLCARGGGRKEGGESGGLHDAKRSGRGRCRSRRWRVCAQRTVDDAEEQRELLRV